MNATMPNDKSCTTQHFPSGCPSPEWTPQELVAYALSQHEAILDDERGLAIKYWRLGVSLNLLRKNFDHGQWERQLKELNIEKTKACRARTIASTFDTEAEVAGLTVKEAYDQRVRKTRDNSKASVAQDEDSRKLSHFLESVTKTADVFRKCPNNC